MVTGLVGLSPGSVGTKPIFCTTRMPEATRPKMECLPSSQAVGPSVMKNWLPFVLGPGQLIGGIYFIFEGS